MRLHLHFSRHQDLFVQMAIRAMVIFATSAGSRGASKYIASNTYTGTAMFSRDLKLPLSVVKLINTALSIYQDDAIAMQHMPIKLAAGRFRKGPTRY